MKISIIAPIFNEKENIKPLTKELLSVLKNIDSYEIIYIDDGSRDGSKEILEEISRNNKHVKYITFVRNFGQTAALRAGFEHAEGDIIVPIDSDLENDPRDILRLIRKIEEGYDVVSGWRQGRWKNKWFTRKLPSMAANKIISHVTGVYLKDHGCTLKAYKRESIVGTPLYGEMHRFLPVHASWSGARVGELPVNHRERMYGKSNYGLSRLFRVLLDLVLVRFLDKYMARPMHFFGGIGFVSLFSGFLVVLLAVLLKLFSIKDFVETPLLLFASFLAILGVQMIVMGVLADIMMRTYYESQSKKPYTIKEKINID